MELIGRSETFVAAPPDRVWAVLADIEGWRGWMPGVRWAVLEGALGAGAYITIRPVRGRQTAYRAAIVVPPRELALGLTFGPVASVLYRWTIESHGAHARIAYSVETGGPLKALIVAGIAAKALADAPTLLAALQAMVEGT